MGKKSSKPSKPKPGKKGKSGSGTPGSGTSGSGTPGSGAGAIAKYFNLPGARFGQFGFGLPMTAFPTFSGMPGVKPFGGGVLPTQAAPAAMPPGAAMGPPVTGAALAGGIANMVDAAEKIKEIAGSNSANMSADLGSAENVSRNADLDKQIDYVNAMAMINNNRRQAQNDAIMARAAEQEAVINNSIARLNGWTPDSYAPWAPDSSGPTGLSQTGRQVSKPNLPDLPKLDFSFTDLKGYDTAPNTDLGSITAGYNTVPKGGGAGPRTIKYATWGWSNFKGAGTTQVEDDGWYNNKVNWNDQNVDSSTLMTVIMERYGTRLQSSELSRNHSFDVGADPNNPKASSQMDTQIWFAADKFMENELNTIKKNGAQTNIPAKTGAGGNYYIDIGEVLKHDSNGNPIIKDSNGNLVTGKANIDKVIKSGKYSVEINSNEMENISNNVRAIMVKFVEKNEGYFKQIGLKYKNGQLLDQNDGAWKNGLVEVLTQDWILKASGLVKHT